MSKKRLVTPRSPGGLARNTGAPLMTRRSLLALGAGLAGTAALAACGGGGGGGGGGGAGPSTLKLPTFVAPRTVDGAIASSVEGVPPAYPAFGTAYRSVTEVPGTGGDVTTFQPLFRSPPPELASNPWWQQLNENLGVNLKSVLAPSNSYPDKISTTIAGGDIPDLTVVSELLAPGAIKLVKQGAFLDLSDRLGGDAVKDFPNLAAIPTVAWQDAAVENRIYGVPMPIASPVWMYRADWAEAIGYPQAPTNAEETKEVLVAFSKTPPPGMEGEQTFGFTNFVAAVEYCQQMFHVPNNWAVDGNGEFTHKIETEEYEQALLYARELWDAGVWHPDAPTHTGENWEDMWLGGRAGAYYLNVTNMYSTFYVDGTKPFAPPAHDGGEQTIWRAPAMFAFTSLPSTVKDDSRVDELLRILNWWASPFGSEEYLYIAYGQEGRQYNLVDGEPIVVDDDELQAERNLYWMVQQFEYTLYFAGHPERGQEAQGQLETIATHAVTDPSRGLYSDEKVAKAASLTQLILDFQNGIVTGRRDISELSELRSRWASGGGDTIKRELAESYTA